MDPTVEILAGLRKAASEYRKARLELLNGNKAGTVYDVENKRKKMIEIAFMLCDNEYHAELNNPTQ